MSKNQQQPSRSMKSYDIEEISEKLIENIEFVLEKLELGVNYYVCDDKVTMPCPVHGGDNPNGFSILLRGVGNWRCFTHNCHEQYGTSKGASLVSFVQAVKKLTFWQTLSYLGKLLGVEANNEDLSTDKEQREFIRKCKILDLPKEEKRLLIPRNKVRQSLKYPVTNILDSWRLFNPSILDAYDVGECSTRNKPMSDRIVVPLYDETGNYMVGCSGRSIYNKCELCNTYHKPSLFCPATQYEIFLSSKWKNSANFAAESYLYNLWKAKKVIEESKCVVLVEGPGDIWRLEEAGIHNGLALLGTKFTDEQKRIIEGLGATTLVIGTDNDNAGLAARNFIRESCGRLFNVYDVIPTRKDFGESPIEEIQELFRSFK